MAQKKKLDTLNNTLTSINTVMAALNAYPSLEDAVLARVQSEANKYLGKLFPTQLDFTTSILEHLVGTDVLIDIVSNFIVVGLPPMELAIKSVLLANMQNLGTNCTIDPFIYEKAIKEGVVFDLRQIDLYDKLRVNPLDRKIGQYFYFGTEGCESAYDILMSAITPETIADWRLKEIEEENSVMPKPEQKEEKESSPYIDRFLSNSLDHYGGETRKKDFDCLLWYMKNKSVVRQVWGKTTTTSESIFYGDEDINKWIEEKGDKKNLYYKISEDGKSITFYGRSSGSGSMVAMDDNDVYFFKHGKNGYYYFYGNPPIYKLNRSKTYVCEKNANTFGMYTFNTDGKWEYITKSLVNYNSEKEAISKSFADGTDIKGEFICVDNKVKEITSYKKLSSPKPLGDYAFEFVNTRECIDVSNDIENNISLFVDYDEIQGDKTKGQMIKDGDEGVTTTFLQYPNNTGQYSWQKKKLSKGLDELPSFDYDCYYQNVDGKDGYTKNVDKILIPPYDDKGVAINIDDAKAKDNKYTKDFGIVTLEYSPRTGNLKQSDGKPLHQQTPYDNVLHIFFGNVKELADNERDTAETNWIESANANKKAMAFVREIEASDRFLMKVWLSKLKTWRKTGKTNGEFLTYIGEKPIYENNKISEIHEYFKSLVNGGENYVKTLPIDHPMYDDETKLSEFLTKLEDDICVSIFSSEKVEDCSISYEDFDDMKSGLNKELQVDGQDGKYYTITAFTKRIAQLMDKNESVYYLKARNFKYPEPEKNYYLKRTLFEFNADYIASLQLFDPKVLAAQLITSLMGGISMHAVIGATATWKTDYIRDLVKDMVQKEIASEDYAISDCFFTFNNDAYNGMLRAAELRQAGLYSKHGEENGNNRVDPISMLDGLNEIDRAADQAGKVEVIKGVITTATGEIATDIYKEESYLSINPQFGLKASFIETLMTDLCTQMVMAILSPKVYLLILMNLEMFGLSTNFNEKTLLENFNNLLRNMIKSIVDYYMQYVMDKIMEIVEELAQRLMTKLAFEQVENYARLIKQILMHLRMFRFTSARRNSGWTQDFISSADITESNDEQEPVDEC